MKYAAYIHNMRANRAIGIMHETDEQRELRRYVMWLEHMRYRMAAVVLDELERAAKRGGEIVDAATQGEATREMLEESARLKARAEMCSEILRILDNA